MSKIKQEDIDKIKEMDSKGASVIAISWKMNCTKGFVRDVLKGKYS